MTPIDFKAEANALRDRLIERRRDFHRHPEIAFEEVRTAGIVAQTLRDLGMEVQQGVGKTGVVGILEGAHDGPTILLRADMDALPVQEENSTDYASTVPGKMHACGHDGHTSVMLGVAELLSAHRDKMAGRIKFTFQPAEEIGEGALAMINDGVLSEPRPDLSLGLHLWNELPYGQVAVTDGPFMAGASIFDLIITGKGGHAALPQLSVDPIVCAAQVVSALQNIVSRNVAPLESAVISVTYVRAGDAYNVTPETVRMRGTIRTFTHDVRDKVIQRMHEVVESVAKGMGCRGELIVQHNTEPVINDAGVAQQLQTVFEPLVGTDNLQTRYQTLAAEDMAYLMTDVPGTYFFVGARDRTVDGYYGHHHPRFSIDEEALPLATALMASAVASYLIPE
jgi:amidohydrolase